MARCPSIAGVRRGAPFSALLVLGLAACSEADAQKSWSELSTCMAGPAAQSALGVRVAQLRAIALGSSSLSEQKSAWPARCASFADELYASLGSSSEAALLKRKLHERLACTDRRGTCELPTDSSLISVETELWQAAASAGLKNEAAPGIAVPQTAPPPLLNESSWQSFSDRSLSLVGPLLTAAQRAVVLLKPSEGRGKPRGCEFVAGFAQVSCFDANGEVPELPAQDVDLVADASGVYAATATEKGLIAYDLKSGQTSDVRGLGPLRLTHEGLAVEHDEQDEGFRLSWLADGKASKPSKLPDSTLGEPLSLGEQVLYLRAGEHGTELVAESLLAGRLQEVGVGPGPFSGALHGCRRNSAMGVAAYGGFAGEHSAKATTSDGQTRVTVTLFQDGAWSKPSSTTMPFERGIESDLVCSKTGASLGYAQALAEGILVGRIDCDSGGCRSDAVRLNGIESKWWWTVGPLGDKVLLMWRSSLGETRLRLAPLAALPTTKDVIVFDAPDFGGPNAGDLSALYTDDDALLIFRGDKPVALHVASDGSVRVVTH